MPTPLVRSGFVYTLITICAWSLTSPHSAANAQTTTEKKPPAPPAKPAQPAKPAKIDYAALFKQHWIDLVKDYREQNKKGYPEKNVVLLGDSITEGFKVGKNFPDRHVLNRGIGADIIGNKLPE